MFLSTQLLTAAIGISAFAAKASAALLPEKDTIPSLLYTRNEASNSSSSWPYGPFSTSGRDILNTKGEAVTFAGVNWPGSGESMVPEGLEWASIEDILSQVKSVGFNFIRLTYAIEMVDQIYERNGEDVGLEISMINALGYENGTKVTNEIIAKNPTFNKDTTRFEIWDHIASVALSKNIYIHPDVHVGKAQWCCNNTDGNAWFDDYNFPVANWKRGLQYVAHWASAHNNVVSMSLRNELRRAINETAPTETLGYNWVTLVGNYTAATDAIHSANPDLLVTWSGMQYDQDLSALIQGKNLNTAPCYKCDAIRDGLRRDPIVFDLASHPWANKVVYELHLYSMSENLDTGSCPIIFAELYAAGFNAIGMPPPPACNITKDCPTAARNTPVIISEFGAAQDVSLFNDTLMNCLQDFTLQNNVSWAMWSLAGSYRIRSGAQGVGDTWALGNYNWTGWNYPEGVEKWWKPWVSSMF